MKRFLLLLIIFVGVATVATGCSSTSPYAAVVNGQAIKSSVFSDELRALMSSPAWKKFADQALGPVGGAQPGGRNTANSQYVAVALANRIDDELFSQEFNRRHLSVPDSLHAQALDEVLQDGAGTGDPAHPADPAAFDNLAANYREYLVTAKARQDAVLNDMVAHDSQYFAQVCYDMVFQPDSPSQADQVEQQVAAGQNFAAIAQAISQQTGAPFQAQPKCVNAFQLNKQIFNQLNATRDGAITAPISSSDGSLAIVQVVGHRQGSAADVPATSQASFLGLLQKRFVADQIAVAHIKVNPVYGTFDPNSTTANWVSPPNIAVLAEKTSATTLDMSQLDTQTPQG